MMNQFTLPLYEDTDRPIVPLYNWHRMDAMIDTGAKFPVWTADESILQDLGARVILNEVKFGGFGGYTVSKVYELPVFQIGDLIYPRLNIIACPMEVPCHIIVSATMLKNLCYEVDDINHKLNVTIPDSQSNIRHLTVSNQNGRLYVLCQSSSM